MKHLKDTVILVLLEISSADLLFSGPSKSDFFDFLAFGPSKMPFIVCFHLFGVFLCKIQGAAHLCPRNLRQKNQEENALGSLAGQWDMAMGQNRMGTLKQ